MTKAPSAVPGGTESIGPLVLRARDGDSLAGRALFDRFQPRVLQYCRLSTNGDEERASDLCQEVFARAFERLRTLDDAERFGGWLFTIAANLCRTEGERRRRWVFATDLCALSHDVLLPEIDDAIDRARLHAALRRALEAVEDQTMRDIARLHYEEATPTRTIAHRLGIPHGTVTVKLMRLRAVLRRALCQHAAEGAFA